MSDGTGLAEALLGLHGFRVLEVTETADEMTISIETTVVAVGCWSCGRLRGKKPKLTSRQEAHLVAHHHAGEHTTSELAELFGVGRSTVYRAIERAQAAEATARTRALRRIGTVNRSKDGTIHASMASLA